MNNEDSLLLLSTPVKNISNQYSPAQKSQESQENAQHYTDFSITILLYFKQRLFHKLFGNFLQFCRKVTDSRKKMNLVYSICMY